MGFLDLFKSKSKPKPSELLKKLAIELAEMTTKGEATLSLSADELNDLETYIAASCAGNIANVYIKKPPKPEEIEKCLSVAQSTNLMIHIANRVACLEPEARRATSAIWGYLLKVPQPSTNKRVMTDYLIAHSEAVKSLLSKYGKNTSSADVIIGVMIRDATRFPQIIEYIFKNDLVYELFPVLTSDNFDVSTDGFQTLKDVLTNHHEISAPWISKNFYKFFPECVDLLKTKGGTGKSDYVTVRQMIALLSTIMLERPFMETMIQFVCHEEFLITTLVLLGNSSKVVQYETFHLFKIFAANPRKPPKVAKLLNQNRDRIIKILDQIEQDRLDDNEFKQDKNAVVAKLNALKQQQQQAAPRITTTK